MRRCGPLRVTAGSGSSCSDASVEAPQARVSMARHPAPRRLHACHIVSPADAKAASGLRCDAQPGHPCSAGLPRDLPSLSLSRARVSIVPTTVATNLTTAAGSQPRSVALARGLVLAREKSLRTDARWSWCEVMAHCPLVRTASAALGSALPASPADAHPPLLYRNHCRLLRSHCSHSCCTHSTRISSRLSSLHHCFFRAAVASPRRVAAACGVHAGAIAVAVVAAVATQPGAAAAPLAHSL